ncbi:hypothetical protein KKF84_13225 [Myxococcota bacterium]|nr:hypothetical protein [Myxococcota bacterium]MBU1536280.1 hypothetical protein [Myxococcota bacterium]
MFLSARVIIAPVDIRKEFRPLVLDDMGRARVVLELTDIKGNTFYGEALPRWWAGERALDVAGYLSSVLGVLTHCAMPSVSNLRTMLHVLEQELLKITPRPEPALAALSTALITCLAHEKSQSVAALFSPLETQKIKYCASIPLNGRAMALTALSTLTQRGFSQFKTRLSEHREKSLHILENIMATYGDSIHIAVDGNAGWSVSEADEIVDALVQMGITLVEQPLPVSARNEMIDLMVRYEGRALFILDQSVECLNDFEWFAANAPPAIVNVKLMKNGGFFKALELYEEIIRSSWHASLGSEVGATITSLSLSRVLAAKTGGFICHEGAMAPHYMNDFPMPEEEWTDRLGEGDVVSIMGSAGLGIALHGDETSGEVYAFQTLSPRAEDPA